MDDQLARNLGKPRPWSRVVLATGMVTALVLVPLVASASKGGSSIRLVYPTAAAAATDGGPHFTEGVGFQISTGYWDPNGTGPWVRLYCYQNAQRVLYLQWGYFTGLDNVFYLGPTALWTGGDADCTGVLGHYGKNMRFHVEATTDFHVAA